jgi:hypothetical protein
MAGQHASMAAVLELNLCLLDNLMHRVRDGFA